MISLIEKSKSATTKIKEAFSTSNPVRPPSQPASAKRQSAVEFDSFGALVASMLVGKQIPASFSRSDGLKMTKRIWSFYFGPRRAHEITQEQAKMRVNPLLEKEQYSVQIRRRYGCGYESATAMVPSRYSYGSVDFVTCNIAAVPFPRSLRKSDLPVHEKMQSKFSITRVGSFGLRVNPELRLAFQGRY